METFFIETAHLILERITPADIHLYYQTMDKETIQKNMGWDAAAYDMHLQMHLKGMETNRLSLCFFILREKKNKQAIGECGFHTWNEHHCRAEVFYKLFKEEHKQKGLMTEALDAVLNYGFTQMKLHRVEALVYKTNEASVKLLQKFGFQFEGTKKEDYYTNGVFEDSESYALLNWEWQANALS